MAIRGCSGAWRADLQYLVEDMISRMLPFMATYGTSIGYNSLGIDTRLFWGEMRMMAVTPELRSSAGGFDPLRPRFIPNNEENYRPPWR